MQPVVTAKRLGWLAATTIILGVIIGAGAGLLTLLLYGVEHVMLGYVEGSELPGPFGVPAVRRAISVTIGLTLAGIIWYFLRNKTTKVPSVKKAVAGERMPVWQTLVHVVLQIGIVGSGASIGREVAPRELGAMLAQRFCDLFHIEGADGIDRRMVVAVAAGAGLGGVYNAPLAGMFFAVEILLVDVTLEKVAFGLGMSAIAAFVAASIKGHHTFYDITAMQPQSTPTLMLFAVLCGAACGVAGAWFRKGSQWAESHQSHDKHILWQMPLAGLVTGLAAIVVPQVMGNGRAAAQLGFSTFVPEGSAAAGASQSASSAAASPWNLLAGGGNVSGSASTAVNADFQLSQSNIAMLLGVLALTFVAKALVTLMTIRSGASGGVLQPGIALGSTLGAMLGLIWILLFPADSVTACALIGAAALLSASQQAPLMAMCLVMELTEAPSAFFVPVGLAVAASSLVSKWMLSRRK
ncbi:chloride channel protein [Bifidobacterium breve]|uniref:Chloride channel protein n=1 Tax=Bifidobacterium breve TaxID=1685 RepID=A0AAW7LJJ8_BIFBR|nr:chloride channel protein [Bifidobacterium breve]MDN4188784.1 chloride channel protein [Bifidobacterium breve]MDU2060455.1 chloride channel protein [Bifidobacterium breve]MDU2070212.1 chloride channel protein [Bifidobacterium breve]MDU3740478.1 chloride channel protein [Bifidobacterium breve]PKY88377.1 chloride channel protein [Bifidobacterium breve]